MLKARYGGVVLKARYGGVVLKARYGGVVLKARYGRACFGAPCNSIAKPVPTFAASTARRVTLCLRAAAPPTPRAPRDVIAQVVWLLMAATVLLQGKEQVWWVRVQLSPAL